MGSTRDILLASPAAESRNAPVIQFLLIVAWHWTLVPATMEFVDWWLGYGASISGVPVPTPFDLDRALQQLVHPLLHCLLVMMVLVEALFSTIAFRILTRRRPADRALFIRLWWRVCLWGALVLPAGTFVVAVVSGDWGLAIRVPLLWVLWMIAGPALLARIHGFHRFPPGHCEKCGYNLTGNISGRCPECGRHVPLGLQAK